MHSDYNGFGTVSHGIDQPGKTGKELLAVLGRADEQQLVKGSPGAKAALPFTSKQQTPHLVVRSQPLYGSNKPFEQLGGKGIAFGMGKGYRGNGLIGMGENCAWIHGYLYSTLGAEHACSQEML